MSNLTTYPESQNYQIWENLKEAIIKSSGFECWQEEQTSDEQFSLTGNLDEQVSSYLRETLETLAY